MLTLLPSHFTICKNESMLYFDFDFFVMKERSKRGNVGRYLVKNEGK